MGKIIFWILVGMVVMLLLKQLRPGRRRVRVAPRGGHADGSVAAAPTHDVMLACSVCQLHLPASEAIFAGGKVYCCEAHRDQGRALSERGGVV